MSCRRSVLADGISRRVAIRSELQPNQLPGDDDCGAARQPTFHSISFIAADLDVSPKSVRRYIERGDLPAYKIGGQIRVSDEDYRQFLKSRRLNKLNTDGE